MPHPLSLKFFYQQYAIYEKASLKIPDKSDKMIEESTFSTKSQPQ